MIFVVNQRRGCVIELQSLDDRATSRRFIASLDLEQMRRPSGIAWDGCEPLVLVDSGNNRVSRI